MAATNLTHDETVAVAMEDGQDEENAAMVESYRNQIDAADQDLFDFWLEHGDNPDSLGPWARSQVDYFTTKYHALLIGDEWSPSSPVPSHTTSETADALETPISQFSFASLNHSDASDGYYPAVNRPAGSRFSTVFGQERTGWRGHGPGGQLVPIWRQQSQTPAQMQTAAGPASNRPGPRPKVRVLSPRQVTAAHPEMGTATATALRPTPRNLDSLRREVRAQIDKWRSSMQEAIEAEHKLKSLQVTLREMLDTKAAEDAAAGRGQ